MVKIDNFIKKQKKYYQYVLDDMKANSIFSTSTDFTSGSEYSSVSIFTSGGIESSYELLNTHNLHHFKDYTNSNTQSILEYYMVKHALQYNEMSYIYHDWLKYVEHFLLKK